MDMKTTAVSASRHLFTMMEQGVAAGAALMAAIYTRAEIIAVIGSIVAATAICGMLGLFFSEIIPALRIKGIEGTKRLIANWCAGLIAYWTAPHIRARYFPHSDIEMVAALTAAAQSVVGVLILKMILNFVAKKGLNKLEVEIEKRLSPDGKPKNEE